MATFPIEHTTASPTGRSGSVMQDINTDTGAGQIAKSVTDLSNTAGKFASMMFRKQGEAELAESMSNANDQVAEMFQGFETNQDESSYAGKWDATFGRIRHAEPKNGWARQQYRKAMFNVKDQIGGAVQKSVNKRINDKHDWAVSKMVSTARQTGNMAALEFGLNGMVTSGTMAKEERDLILTQTQPFADAKAKEINANTFETAIEQEYVANGGDLQAAVDKFSAVGAENKFGLSRDEADSVLQDFGSKVKQDIDRADRVKKDAIQATTLSYYSTAWAGDPAEPVDIDQLNQDAANGLVTVEDRNRIVALAENGTRSDKGDALAKMDATVLQLGDGRVDKQAAVDELKKLSPKLSNETIDEYKQEIEKEFNISQDTAVSEAAKFARTQIVNISETVFDQLSELILLEKETGKKEDLQFELKSKKQQWKDQNLTLHKYNLAMRQYMKDNPKASPEDILQEGMRKSYSEFSETTTLPVTTKQETVKMVGPDGRVFNVPNESARIKKFEDAGYRKQ